MKRPSLFSVATATINIAFSGYTFSQYYEEKQRVIARLHAGSKVIETAHGTIEYATAGQGPAVLIAHAAIGGYDQAAVLARLIRDSFTCILPSRFGYLRTPLTVNPTHAAQADAYAALLDVLEIPSVAMMAFSAGGPSALEFALRYPHRCWGLIMVAAVSQQFPLLSTYFDSVYKELLARTPDYVAWLVYKAAPDEILLFNGVSSHLLTQIKHDNEKMSLLYGVVQSTLPYALRLKGFINDMRQPFALASSLKRISAPVLAIHGRDDPIVPLLHAEHVVQAVSGAELLVFNDGGHLCFATHTEQVQPALINFLTTHKPDENGYSFSTS